MAGWYQGLAGQGGTADKCTAKILEKGVQATQIISPPQGLGRGLSLTLFCVLSACLLCPEHCFDTRQKPKLRATSCVTLHQEPLLSNEVSLRSNRAPTWPGALREPVNFHKARNTRGGDAMDQFSGQRREQPLSPCQATIVVSSLFTHPEGHGTGV